MKQTDLFQLGVRLLGLAFLYQGLGSVPSVLIPLFGAAPFEMPERFRMVVFAMGWPLLLAYWLLRGAPLLMRIAYPSPQASAESPHGLRPEVGSNADA